MSKTRVSNSSASDTHLQCAASGCESPIGSADYAIMCEFCKMSYHHRCIDFSDTAFHSFQRLHTSGLVAYYCPLCKAKISRQAETQSSSAEASPSTDCSVDGRLSKVEGHLDEIKATLDILVGKPSPDPQTTGQEPTAGAPASYAAAASKGVTSPGRVVTVADLHKVKEDEGHRRSLVVAGLPEMGNDLDAASALCRFLDPSACVSDVFRMGRVPLAESGTPNRPRLLKVHLPASSVVKSLLGEARRLKNSSDFKGVYIRRSMTKEEREQLAAIRGQCRDLNAGEETEGVKYAVVGNRIVRFTKCEKEGDRLVGGTRDKSWSAPQGLN